MKKPFYSKRRLKKMGVTITQNSHFLDLNISSEGGSLRQAYNLYKMLKDSKKTNTARVETQHTSLCSMIINSSKICHDNNRTRK